MEKGLDGPANRVHTPTGTEGTAVKYITETRADNGTVAYLVQTGGFQRRFVVNDKANAVKFDDAEAEEMVAAMNALNDPLFSHQTEDCPSED